MSVCVDESVELVDVEVLELDDESDESLSVDVESDDGGGPGGGPGGMDPVAAVESVEPCENVLSNTDLSSLACDEVSEPDETCESIRLEIFDFISDGLGGVDELDCDVWSALRDESIESSADESAVSSVEEMVPEDTSDCSSFCSNCLGEYCCPPNDVDVMEVIIGSCGGDTHVTGLAFAIWTAIG